jgi:hypothetical protein
VTKIKSLAAENLVTPKAGAKHELFFNQPASVHSLSDYQKKMVILNIKQHARDRLTNALAYWISYQKCFRERGVLSKEVFLPFQIFKAWLLIESSISLH